MTSPDDTPQPTEESVHSFLNLAFRNIDLPALDADDIAEIRDALARHAQQAREEERERLAKLVEKRRDDRFAEYGTTEPDTNHSYYSGSASELYESLDEEDEEIAALFRNLSLKDNPDAV